MKGYIYIIRNKINDKVYIGQTVKGVKERFVDHKYNALHSDRKGSIYNAMRLHGVENFYVETLETVEDITTLTDREEYYIRLYDTIKHGYNMKYRVEDPRYKTVTTIDEDQFTLMYYTMTNTELANYLNVSRTAIINRARSLGLDKKPVGLNKKHIELNKTITKDLLIQKYLNENKQAKDIALELNVSEQNVRAKLRKYKIIKQPKTSGAYTSDCIMNNTVNLDIGCRSNSANEEPKNLVPSFNNEEGVSTIGDECSRVG